MPDIASHCWRLMYTNLEISLLIILLMFLYNCSWVIVVSAYEVLTDIRSEQSGEDGRLMDIQFLWKSPRSV